MEALLNQLDQGDSDRTTSEQRQGAHLNTLEMPKILRGTADGQVTDVKTMTWSGFNADRLEFQNANKLMVESMQERDSDESQARTGRGGMLKNRGSVEVLEPADRANEGTSDSDSEFERAIKQLSEGMSRGSGDKTKRGVADPAYEEEKKQGRQGHTFSFGTEEGEIVKGKHDQKTGLKGLQLEPMHRTVIMTEKVEKQPDVKRVIS